MYSAGVTQTSGNSLLAPCISAAKAKGLTDVVVLDHHNFPPFDAHTDFTVYVQALYDTVIAGQADRATRPWVLLAHSHGATGCYGLARLLGPRLRAFVVLGRRAAHVELIDDVFGCATGQAIKELGLHKLTQQLARVYVNPTLEAATSDEDASKWLPMFKEVADIVMAQYSSPVSLCDAEGIEKAIGSSPAKIGAPITAVVSRTETEKGETREKVARWAELTKGAFALEVAECDHMDLPANPAVIKLFADEVARVVGGVEAEPLARQNFVALSRAAFETVKILACVSRLLPAVQSCSRPGSPIVMAKLSAEEKKEKKEAAAAAKLEKKEAAAAKKEEKKKAAGRRRRTQRRRRRLLRRRRRRQRRRRRRPPKPIRRAPRRLVAAAPRPSGRTSTRSRRTPSSNT